MKKKRKLVLLDPEDEKVVDELAAQEGESWQVALRKIIREWARVNTKFVTTGGSDDAKDKG